MQQLQAGKMDSSTFYNNFSNSNSLNSESANELLELTKTYPWFQLAWVLYLKNLKQIESADYKKVLKQVAIRVSSRKLLFNYLNLNNTEDQISVEPASQNFFSLQQDSDSSNASSGDSLIDRFLSSGQGPIRRKRPDEHHSNNDYQDILNKSEAEDDELITETLANIFLQQKNYEKAIQAFEKLSLKYPEKSIYFASRIKEAKELKNIN